MGNMKNKHKYSLDKLTITVTYTAIGTAEVKVSDGLNCIFCRYYNAEEFTPQWTNDFMKWLEKKYYPTILTEKEKSYLLSVIKPYRHNVVGIKKESIEGYKQEWISIQYNDEMNQTYGYGIATLPNFKTGTMYKGMEANKLYTLKELEL